MNRSVLAQVRDIVPIRPLTRHEALSIAERQALLLLELLGVTEPAVPERIIAELPRLEVVRKSPWPVSGATQWVNGRWVIVLNGAEPAVRQRFSLAHELKHIIDHPFIHVLYHGIDFTDRGDWVEQVCDYFAGCLLMPRPWLKRAWADGNQDLRSLADAFQVSQAAMNTRLRQTGLLEAGPRCSRPGADLVRAAMKPQPKSNPYHRTARPLILTA